MQNIIFECFVCNKKLNLNLDYYTKQQQYNYNNQFLYLGLFAMHIENFNCILNTVWMTILSTCICLTFRCMTVIRKILRQYNNLFLRLVLFCSIARITLTLSDLYQLSHLHYHMQRKAWNNTYRQWAVLYPVYVFFAM